MTLRLWISTAVALTGGPGTVITISASARTAGRCRQINRLGRGVKDNGTSQPWKAD